MSVKHAFPPGGNTEQNHSDDKLLNDYVVGLDLDSLGSGQTTTMDPALAQKVEGLQTLSRALLAIANTLSDPERQNARPVDRALWGALARSIYGERERRNEYFPPQLFGEPAWDILLDLFAAAKSNELRSIKEVCISSHVPDATALRYIEQLVELRLVIRRPDKSDSRRKFLKLTRKGYDCMVAYLGSMPAIGGAAESIARGLLTER